MVTLTARKKRVLLSLANAALALGIAAAGALGVLVPLDAARAARPAEGQAVAGDARLGARLQPLAAYAAVARRDLTRPLFDPPPPPPVVRVQPPPPPLAVRLVGTAVESGSAFAWLRTMSGQVKIAAVGDTVEGAQVLAVASGSATVRFNGQTCELKIERADAPLPGESVAALRLRPAPLRSPRPAVVDPRAPREEAEAKPDTEEPKPEAETPAPEPESKESGQ